MAEAATTTDAPPQRPRVLLLSLSSTPSFDDMYSDLIDELFEHATIQRASKPGAAIRYLSSNTPTAILATDPGLTERKYSDVLDKVLRYTRSGGTLIFCCMFSSFIRASDFDRFMRTKLNLPWEFGHYTRTTVHLNQRMTVHQINRARLQASYSQKAVHLKNVEPTAALYLPKQASVVESNVWSPTPVDREQTPVAFTAFGQGRLGYVGDVNGEKGSDEVILAMCGL